MLTVSNKTIEKTYKFDELGRKTGEVITETVNDCAPTVTCTTSGDASDEIGDSFLAEGLVDVSPLETFLAACIGTVVGTLLCQLMKKE